MELYKNGAKKFNVNRGERACCSKPGAVVKRFVCGTGVTRFCVANIASIRASCASLGPVFCQAAGGFGVVEARRHAAPQPLHDLFRGQGMPVRGFTRSRCVNLCIYAGGDGALKM
jgi:hypothetical protein